MAVFKELNGTWKMTVTPYTVGDKKFKREKDGKEVEAGRSLTQIRKDFDGKDEGYMRDASGGRHHLSLKQWEKLDQNKTFLNIAFDFYPDTRQEGENN
jgi:hypothetical protein